MNSRRVSTTRTRDEGEDLSDRMPSICSLSDGMREKQSACVAADLKTLEELGRGRLLIGKEKKIRVVRDEDGTSVDSDACFHALPPFVKLIFLTDDETWSPDQFPDPQEDDSGQENIVVPKDRASSEIARYCKRNTYQRLAMTLVLLGPKYLEVMLDEMQSAPHCFHWMETNTLDKLCKATQRVLSNHKNSFNSMELLADRTMEKDKCLAVLAINPCWGARPAKRLGELMALCSENIYERCALVLCLLGLEYIQAMSEANESCNPGLSKDLFNRIKETAWEVFQDYDEVIDCATLLEGRASWEETEN